MSPRLPGPVARLAVVLTVVGLPVTAVATTPTSAVAAAAGTAGPVLDPGVSAGPGDYVGGGTINVIARAPGAGGHFVAGGDSEGLYRSDDGITWSIANDGLTSKAWTRVAAVTYAAGDPARSPVWLAAAGDAGSSGGGGSLLASSDDGASWQPVRPMRFDGANPAKGVVPHDHPRSIGHLLQVATVAGRTYVFAGTFDTRVVRCELVQPETSGGSVACVNPLTLRVPAGTGKTHNDVRSLALDVSGSSPVLYSASYFGSILRYTGLDTANPRVTTFPSPMTHVEELAVAGGLVVAAGDGGLAVSRTTGGGWVRPAGVPARTFTSVATSVNGPVVTVTAGSCLVSGTCRDSRQRDTSNQIVRFAVTPSRTSLALSPVRDLTGTLDPTTASPYPDAGTRLGGNVWVGGDLLVDPGTGGSSDVWVTGRGAIYRTTVPTDGSPTWARTTAGLPMTFSRRIAVTGSTIDDESVAFTDADWIQVTTGSGLTAPLVSSGADVLAAGGSAGLDLAWSQDPDGGLTGTLVTSTGNQKTNTAGSVSVRPAGSALATPLPLPTVGDARALGIDAQDVVSDAGTTTEVAAWFQGSGLQLWDGTSWTPAPDLPRALLTAAAKGGRDVQVLWAPRAASVEQGSRGVFVSVPSSTLVPGGVWHFDGVSTWTAVFTPDVPAGTDYLAMAGEGTGDGFSLLVASDRDVRRYAFAPDGTAVPDGSFVLDADHGDIAGLAVARHTGRPAVVTGVDPVTGAQPDLLLLDPELTTATPVGARDLPAYRSQARFPVDVALSADGERAYVTTQGQGVVAVSGLQP